MAPAAGLNRGKRCVEELDKFDQLMGWTFRELRPRGVDTAEDDADRELRVVKQRELSQTAFGDTVDIPREFVAPVSAPAREHARASKHKARKKASAVQSNVYSKRAMAATASSAAKTAATNSCSSSSSTSNTASHRKRSGATETTTRVSATDAASGQRMKAAEPVDFVYDIGVRRKLREEIDSERAKTLQDAVAKEAQLRAAHKWVYDKAAAARPDRAQAWSSSERDTTRPHHTRDATTTDAKPVRAPSAASSRSSSARSSRSPPPMKSSIAPNVSEWRTQAFPVFPSRDAAMAERRRIEQQRQEQQLREAKDVRDTIDVFESRMHQLAI